jgi:hypothetical protein
MRIRLGTLRRIIREALANQQAEVPGRWRPSYGDPVSRTDADRLGDSLGELDEVDTDPANNPGRPSDAFDYIGMHPKPEWALAHPAAGGAGGEGGEGEGSSEAEPADGEGGGQEPSEGP